MKIDSLIKDLESQLESETDAVTSTMLADEVKTLKEQKDELNKHIETKKEDAGGVFG